MKKISQLSKIQKKFWNGVLGDRDTSLFTSKVARGLKVYQDAYYLRILDSLRSDYETVAAIVGDKKFEKLVKAYLSAHPSEHFSLRYMGKKFPAFLAKDQSVKDKPWLVEAARYEWLKLDLYDVKDHGIVTKSDLTKVPPEKWARLRIKFISHLQILRLNHEVEEPTRIKNLATNSYLAVWRKKEDVHFRRLDKLETKTLKLLQSGKTFGEACDFLAKHFKDADQAATYSFQILSRWLFDEIMEELKA